MLTPNLVATQPIDEAPSYAVLSASDSLGANVQAWLDSLAGRVLTASRNRPDLTAVTAGAVVVQFDPSLGHDLSSLIASTDANSPTTAILATDLEVAGQQIVDGVPVVMVRRTGNDFAEKLLAELRERNDETRPLPIDGTDAEAVRRQMGPDQLGVFGPPSPPPFGTGPAGRIPVHKVRAYLRKLDLNLPAPQAADLALDALDDDGGVITVRRAPDSKWWNRRQKTELASDTVKVAPVHFSAWLGGAPMGAPTQQWRDNLAASARDYAGKVDFVALSSISRATFTKAKSQQPPLAGPDPLEPVRQFLKWAKDNGIILIAVDDLFNQARPMKLDALYRLELARQDPPGFTAAADILKLELMRVFGGAYSDGHKQRWRNLLTEWNRILLDQAGWAVSGSPGKFNNSGWLGPAGHPIFDLWLDKIRDRYTKSWAKLYGGKVMMRGRDNWIDVKERYPFFKRTGPDMVKEIEAVVTDAYLFPYTNFLNMTHTLTWMMKSSALPGAEPMTEAHAIKLGVFAAASLIVGLHENDGVLPLSAVAQALAKTPHGEAAWQAIVAFLAENPALAAKVTHVNDEHRANDGTVEPATPPLAWGGLGIDTDPAKEDSQLGDRIRPAKLIPPTTSTPTQPSATTTTSTVDAGGAPAAGTSLTGEETETYYRIQISNQTGIAKIARTHNVRIDLRLRHEVVRQRIKLASIEGLNLNGKPAPSLPGQPTPDRLAAWALELTGYEKQLDGLDQAAWIELQGLSAEVNPDEWKEAQRRSRELASVVPPEAGQTWLPTWLSAEQNHATAVNELVAELAAAAAMDVFPLLTDEQAQPRFHLDLIYAALPIMRSMRDELSKWKAALDTAEAAAARITTTNDVPDSERTATPPRQIFYSAVPAPVAFTFGLPKQARPGGTAAMSLANVPSRQRAEDDDPPLGYLYTTVPGATGKDAVAGAFPVLGIDEGTKTVEVGPWQRNPTFAYADPGLEAQAAYAFLTKPDGQAAGYQVRIQQSVQFRQPPVPQVLLNSQQNADLFVQEARRRLWPTWREMSAEARIDAVKPLVNETLSAAGVFPVTVRARPDLTGAQAGAFDRHAWSLGLSVRDAGASDEPADFEEWVRTVYHEMFHAYQFMAMARLLSGVEDNVTAVAKHLAIPQDVVTDAKTKPLVAGDQPTGEYLATVSWWETLFTEPHEKHKIRVQNTQPDWAAAAVKLAKHRFQIEPVNSDDYDRLDEDVNGFADTQIRTITAYRELPLELDAFAAEELITFPPGWIDESPVISTSSVPVQQHVAPERPASTSQTEDDTHASVEARRLFARRGGLPGLPGSPGMEEADLVWTRGKFGLLSLDQVYLVVPADATPDNWATTPWLAVHSGKPVVQEGQRLIRLKPTPRWVGKWAANLAQTRARMVVRGVAETELPTASAGQDLLLPASVLAFVSVDKVYQPGQNVLGETAHAWLTQTLDVLHYPDPETRPLLPRRKVRKILRLVGRSAEQVGVRWPSADTGVAWLLLNRALDDSQLRFDDLGVWLRWRKPDTVPAGHFLYRVRLPRKAAVKLAGPAGEDLFLPRQAEASTLVEKVYPRGGVVAGRMGHADVLVNQALSGFGRQQPDAAAELRVITDVGKFNPMQLLPAVGAMVWPDARPQDEWVGSDRPNWPNDALLAVGPGKSKRSFDEGLLPTELGGPVVGDGSVKWREAFATGDG